MMNRHAKERLINSIAITVVLMLFFTAVIFFSSCSKKIYVPVEKIKTEYLSKTRIDTVFLKDSIYYSYIQKGDTVYFATEKIKYLYRNKILLDTVFKTDTITVTETETVTIEKPLKWYEKIPLYIGLAVIGVLIFRIYSKIKNIFK